MAFDLLIVLGCINSVTSIGFCHKAIVAQNIQCSSSCNHFLRRAWNCPVKCLTNQTAFRKFCNICIVVQNIDARLADANKNFPCFVIVCNGCSVFAAKCLIHCLVCLMIQCCINTGFSMRCCTKNQTVILKALQILGYQCICHLAAVITNEISHVQEIVISIHLCCSIWVKQDLFIPIVHFSQCYIIRMRHVKRRFPYHFKN